MSRAREEIEDDDPITLAEASKLVLKGAVKVSTLRAEVRRGNLAAEKIGKNLFTTPADIKQMREKCRVQLSRQDSTSETTAAKGSGSSGTKDATVALAALKATATALINGSLNTSLKKAKASQRRGADLIPFSSRR